MLETAIPALERLQARIADTHATWISDFHNALPELEQLEHMLAEDRARQKAVLHKFDADELLKRLEARAAQQRSEFDALDFIGQLRLESGRAVWGSEEFHSGVLAWLLDPTQSHGIDVCFLDRFLLCCGVPLGSPPLDWSAAKVFREWENEVDGQRGFLDILILNRSGASSVCRREQDLFQRAR